MPRFIQPRFHLLCWLLALSGPIKATEIINRFTATTSAVENRCFATTASTNGDDCSTNAGNPSGLGKKQWIGPVFGAGYYAAGTGSQFYGKAAAQDPPTAPQHGLPLAGTSGINVTGIIGMNDAGTPADPTDDLYGGSLEFAAYDRIFDFGDGTFGLEHNQPALHGLVMGRVTSAVKNAAGGYDYVVGKGLPVLAEATTAKDRHPDGFPSAVASRSTPDPNDKPFWAAPAAVGVATFERNVGTFTKAEATPTGYSCLMDKGEGPIPCPEGPAEYGGPAYVFQNVLMRISTDAKGRITTGHIVLVQERKALPGSTENDSWQALTLSYTGTIDARPAAIDDVVPLKGNKPLTIKVLANDTGLADQPLTVEIAVKPTRGTASVNSDNMITYVPNPGTTSERFKYRVTDRNGDTAIGKIIVGSNSLPVAHDDLVNLNGLRSDRPTGKLSLLIPYLANDTGLDDSPVTARIIDKAAHGIAQVEPARQQIYYMPGKGFFGTDTFRYQLQDADDEKSTALVTVRGLFAVPDTANGSSGVPVQLDVLQNDVGRSDSPVVVAISRHPAHGSAVVNADNTVTYISEAGFTGSFPSSLVCPMGGQCGDSFDYTLNDKDGDAATTTVYVNVSPAPDRGKQ